MLIIGPPSESKRPPPDEGPPVDLDALSFPALTPTRTRVVDAVMATSRLPDAFPRLHARMSKASEVLLNTHLLDLPAAPAADVYTGPFHQGLDAATLTPSARDRASRDLVVASAVWGLIRVDDRIPSYRCHICARLEGMDRLEPTWRRVLPDVLAAAAGDDGVVLDLRSPVYQAAGTPTGLEGRRVTLRVRKPHGGPIGDVVAKRVRGEAAREVLESGTEIAEPEGVADVLGGRWPVDVEPPPRPQQPWTVTLFAPG